MTERSQGFAPSPARRPAERAEQGVLVANPIEFIREVQTETKKVVWPTRRETMITTFMVFLMCTFAAIFFFVVDRILGWGVGLILG